jgi:hypothetical protein
VSTMKPSIYIAISPALFDEIEFGRHLPGLLEVAQVERWQGEGSPSPEAVLEAVDCVEILVTGWGTPSLVTPLQNWSPEILRCAW